MKNVPERAALVPESKLDGSYPRSMALSLTVHAGRSPLFAFSLAEIIRNQDFYPKTSEPWVEERPETQSDDEDIEIIAPDDDESAYRRAIWLFSRISRDTEWLEKIMPVVLNWSRSFEDPKQIVVGIAVGVIPGVTLGRIKRRDVMSVIIREDLTMRPDRLLERRIVRASTGVVTTALDRSNGDIRNMEPEVGDWLFGEREMSFYICSGQVLGEIANILNRLKAVHCSVPDHKGIAVLAASPSVRLGRFPLEPVN